MKYKTDLTPFKIIFSIIILILISLLIAVTISTFVKFNKNDVRFMYKYLSNDPVKQIDISINNIPQSCINALIATEDKTFYSNVGIDINGIYRYTSSLINGDNTLGGSTISQQLIKNIDYTFYNDNLINKYLEVVKAVKLNIVLTKDEILEEYLNNIYLGNFNYGIEASSINYFSKSAKFLNTKECSYIIGLINSPETLNPYKDLNSGIDRSNIVLDLMLKNKYISDNEYLELIKEPLKIKLISNI